MMPTQRHAAVTAAAPVADVLLAAAWVLLFCLCAWGDGVHITLLWGWATRERDSHTAAALVDAERVLAAAAAAASGMSLLF
jgi:hypothetical protein